MATEVLLYCFSSEQVCKRTVEERRHQNLCDKHNSYCLKKVSAKLYLPLNRSYSKNQKTQLSSEDHNRTSMT